MSWSREEVAGIVEGMVTRQGEFSVPDLLVETFRLAPEDLERWRARSSPALTGDLFGDHGRIAEEIEWALAHARSLDLRVETNSDRPTGGALPKLAADWAQLTLVPPAAPQLDLFMNGADPGRAHRLRQALVARDRPGALAALAELERADPGHALLPAAPALIEAVGRGFNGEREDWQWLEALQLRAEASLGDSAQAFLAPLWRALAVATAAQSSAHQHPSAAWMRVPDWDGVLASIGPDPARVDSPELLARGALASERSGAHRDALRWLYLLCWRFPETVDTIEHVAESLNLDAALDAWFDAEWPERIGWEALPAWLVIGRWTPADRGAAEGGDAEDYLAACEAVTAPRDVAARQKLKAEAPILFRLFMARYS
ncbi:MAG: hypothetical protein AAGE01_07110 [Pseudomonadota bacterium]